MRSLVKTTMSSFSHRLQAIALEYNGAGDVYDIGCDHGILGLSFTRSESAQTIHFVDPSLAVINDLRKKLITSHIPIRYTINILHRSGQEIDLVSKPKCIFIAGMGGKEILEITQHLLPQMKASDRLVVSPHRKILELRNYLHSSELGLVNEKVVEENQQFYQIITMEKSSELPRVPLYGEKLFEGLTGKRYLEHEMTTFSRHKDEKAQAYVLALQAKSAT